MLNKLKELINLQLKDYFKTNQISLFDDLANQISQILNNCKSYAPSYFTDEYNSQVVPALIDGYKAFLENEEILIGLQENILNYTFIDEFKDIILTPLESNLCENFAEIFFKEIGKDNIEKGIEKLVKSLFCNKKNYDYFFTNSKEFALLISSMSEKNKKTFLKKQNSFFNQYINFQNNSFIFALFPLSLIYLLFKKLSKQILGISSSREDLLANSSFVEMLIILEKVGYWK